MRRMVLGTLLAFFATAAMAADLFTLNVPVEVSHLHPSVTQIRVLCHLTGRDAATGNPTNYGPTMGKSQTFPVTAGAFTGTALIVFNTADFTPAQLTNLTSVSSGDCMLQLFASGNWYQPYSSSTGPVVAHAVGTPFNSQSNFTVH
jgi:hypothetical protein